MSTDLTRRDWTRLALTGAAGLFVPSLLEACASSSWVPSNLKGTAAATAAKDLGVILGAQTYSFRDRDLTGAILAMQELGIKSCELWGPHAELKVDGKNWRQVQDFSVITGVREKLDKAGISVMAFTAGFGDRNTDEDIELSFKIAQALGCDTINSSCTVSVVKRVDKFAQKYKTRVAVHNHSNIKDPNQMATPDSFARSMNGSSDYIGVNLDIGHFTAANFDAVDYLKTHHRKVWSIHIKDRKKNEGANVPLGEGDTPIKEVLRLIRDNKWPIPANIEYEYRGAETVSEVRKCLDYCRAALNG